MNADMGCAQVRELAPELALGIAEGDERGAALRHLSGCAGCRRLVSELASVGDELLLLAPAEEPPPEFESRVLGRLAEPARPRGLRPRTRHLRWVAVAAALVLVAALGGGSVFLATAGDRRLADGYRAVLRQGQGSFFAAAPLQGPRGRVGTVFGYQGQPSWAMVTLRPPIPAERRFQVQVLTRDGRYLAVGEAVLGGAKGTWGVQLPVDLSAVHQLRLVGSDGRTEFAATFDVANPWE
jgi:hypothetical protein